MKYITYSIIILILAIFEKSYAQTNVSGIISSNTVWNAAGNPYIVIADVFVDPGVVLTIDPGVTVKFDFGTSIGVNGTIRAVGTQADPIFFEADTIGNPVEFYWAGIYITASAQPFDFTNLSGCFFQYCNFSFSGAPNLYVDLSGNTTLTVFSLVSLGFDHCYVEFSACGLTGASGSQISNNIFKECTSDYSSTFLIKASQNSAIYNNLIYKTGVSTSFGIISVNKNISVHNNLFIGNSFVFSNVLNFEDSCQFYNNTFVDNSVDEFSVAMKINGSSIFKNTFTRNQVGLETFVLSSCDPDFHNNNILLNPSQLQGQEFEMTASSGAGQTATEEGNYWGFSDSASISVVITDFHDNAALCNLDFVPFDTSPDTTAPVLPVGYVSKKDLFNNSVRVTWNKNIESDLKGYRVYYGGYNGYSFTNFLDAGLDTVMDIAGIPISEHVAVTAYDISADGITDQYDGHESWFTDAVEDTTVGIGQVDASKNKVIVSPNPSTGNFEINIPASYNNVLLNIFDMEGRKLISSAASGLAPNFFTIGEQGIYLLQVVTAGSSTGFQKIVVIR